jgi:hypothetical protein
MKGNLCETYWAERNVEMYLAARGESKRSIEDLWEEIITYGIIMAFSILCPFTFVSFFLPHFHISPLNFNVPYFP